MSIRHFFENPIQTKIEILPYLSNHQRVKFETVVQDNTGILPEVGLRAFINFVLHNGDSIYRESEGNWNYVQQGRYRFFVQSWPAFIAKIVFSEYLACTVEWGI